MGGLNQKEIMTTETELKVANLSLYYGSKQALDSISLDISKNKITALIGPSGCGKSTFLRCINRMNDLVDGVRIEGSIRLGDVEINDQSLDVIDLRRQIGMVFQKPVPFPKSIYENVIYGMRLQGINSKVQLDEVVQRSLIGAGLWDEVKDRLDESAINLSGGQHQRLCIARAIAIEPEIILMDEPCSALDPKSTSKVEEMMLELREKYTIIIVTHNMQQASRISDYTAFFFEGKLIEYGLTGDMFVKPKKKATEDYITGRFG